VSEDPPTIEERREAAAIRRRWISLGEGLAIIAVVISGLTLWNNYQDRQSREAEQAAEKKSSATRAATLLLRGTAGAKGAKISIAPADAEQAIQSQRLVYPSALGADPIETVADARIEAGWIKDALGTDLLKAERGGGDQRLPVLITTRFEVDGEAHVDTAIYDVGYRTEKEFLDDTDVILRGLSIVERTSAERGPAALDTLWKRRQPTSSSSEKK
jgi:hypothetical protein